MWCHGCAVVVVLSSLAGMAIAFGTHVVRAREESKKFGGEAMFFCVDGVDLISSQGLEAEKNVSSCQTVLLIIIMKSCSTKHKEA